MALSTQTPPKDGLIRAMTPGLEVRAAPGTGMPTLFGYMLRFNEATEIDSLFEGRFIERIAPGAAKKTLTENREAIRILFNHGRDPHIGAKPLAAPDLREDSEGVRYEGEMFDTSYNRDLIPGLEGGQFGSSIKFRVTKEEFDEEPKKSAENPEGLPERTIKEIRLYEGGPVTFPAYEGTTAGVRSLTDQFVAEQILGKEGVVPLLDLEPIVARWAEGHREEARELLVRLSEVRGPIAYQKTATSGGSWDAGANEKRLPSPMPTSKTREAYAWMDDGAVKDGMCPKSAAKFIHHEVTAGGDVGPANLTACSAGIAVLNGGRGGTTIPGGDRQGVYNHLARHLRDGGKEPPPLRSLDNGEEMSYTETQHSPGAERTHSQGSRAVDLQVGGNRHKRALEKRLP